MKKSIFFFLFYFILLADSGIYCQTEQENVRIMFWNVENLFDPFNDSLTLDDEFTSTGNHGWTWKRFDQKKIHIYKVIISGGWEPPDIIGLCEVENRWVLEQLTRMTPLSKYEYRIIHHNSPDLRGIDVAILYLPQSFKPFEINRIPVTGLRDDDDPTRDILFVKGILYSLDTVNIFVNHWPSRYPGQVETMHKRAAAARILKQKTDSLNKSRPGSRIIIMGDFNDEPWDESLSEILEAEIYGWESSKFESPVFKKNEFEFPEAEKSLYQNVYAIYDSLISGDNPDCNDLHCLIPTCTKSITGTLKFEGKWYLFDQFMLSSGMIDALSSFETRILIHDFLLEPDEAYTGVKPFRTYNGYIYKGGYSDHLPVLLELKFQ